MVSYVFPPPTPPALAIHGREELFPVHRIYCVGRNFADHAVEMGGDPDKEPPFFFQKNPDTLVPSGSTIPYPPLTHDFQHEIEMVVALKAGGENISAETALDCVFGYAVGIDLTRRDLQMALKKLGRSWEVAKAFEGSAPCSALVPVETCGHPDKGAITLKVNDQLRQSGDLDQMIWKVPEMIATLSTLFRLAPGDLIYCGTPSGVGALVKGDVLEGAVEGVGEIRLIIA